ncbi:MAG: 50S ribosomal protein L11 methyltransferase [Bdellovibrionales bacterium]
MTALWQLIVQTTAQKAESVSDAVAEQALAVDIDIKGKKAMVSALFSVRLDAEETKALVGTATAEWKLLEQQDWLAAGGRDSGAGSVGLFRLTDAPTMDTRLVTQKQLYVQSAHAFGDGYHATTQGCLRALQFIRRRKPVNIADIGCGTGVLALAARKLWPAARLVASDIDVDAVAVTRRNLADNAGQGIMVLRGPGLQPREVARRRPYDIVIANILAGPLTKLARNIKNSLKKGGYVVVSGLLAEQTPLILKAYRLQRLHLCWRFTQDGWTTLVLR